MFININEIYKQTGCINIDITAFISKLVHTPDTVPVYRGCEPYYNKTE